MSISYFYKYLKGTNYLIIEKGVLKQNYIFGKKIDLSEIKSIKHFAGDYILRTVRKELKINTKFIEEKSLVEFNEILKKLDLPEGKNAIC